jgi:hypothetical protein
MKSKDAATPLRGNAAYLAQKAAIAKRNDAARTRICDERADQRAKRAEERRRQERLEASSVPEPTSSRR